MMYQILRAYYKLSPDLFIEDKAITRCPFSFLFNFERWWEWQRRTKWEKENPIAVSIDMLGFIRRLQQRLERQILNLHPFERGKKK